MPLIDCAGSATVEASARKARCVARARSRARGATAPKLTRRCPARADAPVREARTRPARSRTSTRAPRAWRPSARRRSEADARHGGEVATRARWSRMAPRRAPALRAHLLERVYAFALPRPASRRARQVRRSRRRGARASCAHARARRFDRQKEARPSGGARHGFAAPLADHRRDIVASASSSCSRARCPRTHRRSCRATRHGCQRASATEAPPAARLPRDRDSSPDVGSRTARTRRRAATLGITTVVHLRPSAASRMTYSQAAWRVAKVRLEPALGGRR